MAENKEYELLSAYVKLLPSMKGFTGAVAKELGKSNDAISSSFDKAFKKVSSSSLTDGLLNGLPNSLLNGMKSATSGITSILKTAVSEGAAVFGDTLKLGASAVGATLMAGVGAVGTQVVSGGFNRALGINQAEAKLQALGYTSKELEKIMENSGNAIDGTSYAMNEAVTTASQFLSAGISPGEELEGSLKTVSKLADISGRSFNDMGSIMAKNASAGIVQWGDLVQLIDAGIPVQDYLAKSLGKSTAEVRKMASAGKITYEDFANAINDVDFDSVLFATKDISKAYENVKSQLSKTGANFWTPIFEGLGPILNNVRIILKDFQSSDAFGNIVKSWDNYAGKYLVRLGNKVKDFSFAIKDTNVINEKFKDLSKVFKELKSSGGPILGIIAGLSGSLLSQIPIIGSMFSGLTVPVGLFGGTLIQIFKNSEKLQQSFGKLWETGKNLFSSFNFGIDGSFFKDIGDSFADIIDLINETINNSDMGILNIDFGNVISSIISEFSDFVKTILPSILPFIKKVAEGFKNFFDPILLALNIGDGGVGEGLGNIVNSLLDPLGDLIISIGEIAGTLAATTISIFKSDAFQGIINWILDIAGKIVSNKGILISFASVAGTIFVGNKLFGPLNNLFKFINGTSIGSGSSKLGISIGKVISGFIQGIANVASVVISNLPNILLGIGGIGLIIGAVAGIYQLLNSLGLIDQLQNLGDALIEGIVGIVNGIIEIVKNVGILITDIIDNLLIMIENNIDTISEIVDILVNGVLEIMTGLTDGLTSIIDSTSGLIETIINGVIDLTDTLSVNGVTAGEGAFVLAAGLTALSTALLLLSGGELINSFVEGLGNLWTGFTEFLTGGKEDPSIDLMNFINGIIAASSIIETLPEKWSTISGSVFSIGYSIPRNMATGINMGIPILYSSILNMLNSVLTSMQEYLNNNPLKIKAEVDRNSKNIASRLGSSIGSVNQTQNNTIKNFNVNSQNESFIRSLSYAAR